MLSDSKVTANIPASDLQRARDFYADTLGLSPTQELPGEVLLYRTAGGTDFQVYRTDYAGQAGHTIAQWHVDDIE
jgi:catechol 2,3-dioxygenase-like lactoylglutathione lyase family enzyme